MKNLQDMPENRNVEITDNYEYANGFKGLKGILTRITPEGANIWLPINQGGSYTDQIYWFPFNCFESSNN